jgi:putative transcriptional regulator
MAKKTQQYNRVKAVLAEKGVTSRELAKMLNLSEQTISKWCTNTRQPALEMLFEVAKVLKVEPKDLLGVG